MTNHDELTKRILWRAIDNGYSSHVIPPNCRNLVVDARGTRVWIGEDGGVGKGWLVSFIIYQRDFCKAFFGERPPGYEYHQRELMYAKDPIVYLSKYL